MSNEAIAEVQNPEQPVVETPAPAAPAPELPELVHSYQPTDESGRPLGGRQVIKYRTPEELAQKLTEQNILLVRRLREETRKQRLGIVETDEIPAEAQRFDTPVEFKPRELSSDERVKLSRDLLDPESFNKAADTLFEATVGANPATLRNTLTNLQQTNLQLVAGREADAFVAGNPDYYKCRENFEAITNWMTRYNLAPLRDNFQLAYDKLNAAGLLLKAPSVREDAPTPTPPPTAAPTGTEEQTPANPQPAQEADSRITEQQPAQTKRPVVPIPSGLTRNQTSDTGAPAQRGNYTLAEIDKMPSDVYKHKLLREPGFRELVEKLEKEASQSRNR